MKSVYCTVCEKNAALSSYMLKVITRSLTDTKRLIFEVGLTVNRAMVEWSWVHRVQKVTRLQLWGESRVKSAKC